MKAAAYHRYGSPEVVSIVEVPKPIPQQNDVLIRIHASTVNRTDCGFRSAEYFISRLFSGLFKPKNKVLGCEFAGVIEAVGSQVTEFKVGNKVFGYDDERFGGHAEYKVIREDKALALIPEGLDFATAAALTEGSHYALSNIRSSKIGKGDSVLVYGATGAIGSAAVQLLKVVGVYIVAVCNSKNVELVKSLGADEVIDYQQQDFTKISQRFDFVFDAVGKSSFRECKPLMKEKGVYISTELGKNSENIWLAMTTRFGRGKRVLFPLPLMKKEDLLYIRDLTRKGTFKPVIDKYYALDEIVEAHRYVEKGQKTGNVIVNIL